MGTNLYPRNTKLEGEPLDYNCIGYQTLTHYLKSWGVDVSEFNSCNEGYPISAKHAIELRTLSTRRYTNSRSITDDGSKVMPPNGDALPKLEGASSTDA
jgi:hypothetical protein